MKKLILLLFVFPSLMVGQNSIKPNGGGEYVNQQTEKCLPNLAREQIQNKIKQNIELLKNKGIIKNKKSSIVSFDWPLRQNSALNYNSYYGVANFVDQDTSTNILDYNCSARTYDEHQGTDIFLWPFAWNMVDNDLVEVIAADAGIIVYKADGNIDDHCSWNMGGSWNAVSIQHADGSITWYGHMKENSVTTKAVGQAVSKGEYLGIVASSGFSTGPHLHFEVYDSLSNLINPYQGSCNSLNSNSWWANQKPFREPTLNAILTHNHLPFQGCPSIDEIPNFSNSFIVGDTVFFAIYFHDQLAGDSVSLEIRKPDNSVWQDWSYSFSTTYSASWYYWYWLLPTNGPFGTWTFETVYNGNTYQHPFTYNLTTNLSSIYSNTKRINKIVDIMGKTTAPKHNTLLFYIYDDGSVEKKIIFE